MKAKLVPLYVETIGDDDDHVTVSVSALGLTANYIPEALFRLDKLLIATAESVEDGVMKVNFVRALDEAELGPDTSGQNGIRWAINMFEQLRASNKKAARSIITGEDLDAFSKVIRPR